MDLLQPDEWDGAWMYLEPRTGGSINVGDRVQRGPSWEWQEQDSRVFGAVVDITTWNGNAGTCPGSVGHRSRQCLEVVQPSSVYRRTDTPASAVLYVSDVGFIVCLFLSLYLFRWFLSRAVMLSSLQTLLLACSD